MTEALDYAVWFWLPWVAAGLTFQLWAVFSKRTGHQLTSHWRWLRDNTPDPFSHIFVAGTAIGIVWLFLHWIVGVL